MLQVPCIEMDRLFWGPNWHKPDDDEFFNTVREALKAPAWVLDGNYTRTIPIKWAEVDWVIWLDYSLGTTLWQAVKRAVRRAWSKEELWPGTGNRESFRQTFFSKDSMIWWSLTTHRQTRVKYEGVMADPEYARVRFVRLRNHMEAAVFLREMAR